MKKIFVILCLVCVLGISVIGASAATKADNALSVAIKPFPAALSKKMATTDTQTTPQKIGSAKRILEAEGIGCDLPRTREGAGKSTKSGGDDDYICVLTHPNFDMGQLTQDSLRAGLIFTIRLTSHCPDPATANNPTIVNLPPGFSVTQITPTSLYFPAEGQCEYTFVLSYPCDREDPTTWAPVGIYQFKINWNYLGYGIGNHSYKIEVVESEIEEPVEPNTSIHLLERGRGENASFDQQDAGLIAGFDYSITPGYGYGYYRDVFGAAIDEVAVSNVNADTFGKLGFTADGNTLLMIRVQTTVPTQGMYINLEAGSQGNDTGFKIYNLAGVEFPSTSDAYGVVPTPLGNIYQATFILRSPSYYGRANARNNWVDVRIRVTDENDEYVIEDMTKGVLVTANPIVFVHGLWGDIGTFGNAPNYPGETADVHSYLVSAGYPVIYEHKYDGKKGPSETMSPNDETFVAAIHEAINRANRKKLASTKVDIIAHSMGGLYSRKFLLENNVRWDSPVGYYDGLVRRLITVATPHNGSEWIHYLFGEFDRMPRFNALAQEYPLIGFMKNQRPLIIREIQRFSVQQKIDLGRISVGSNVESEVDFDTFEHFISALEDLNPDSDLIRMLNAYAASTSVPIYGVSGNARLGLAKLLQEPSLFPIGDLDLSSKIPEILLMLADAPMPFRTIIEKAPAGCYASQLLPALTAVFGNMDGLVNDLVVGNSSSKWTFDTYHETRDEHWNGVSGRIQQSHTMVTKTLGLAMRISDLLDGPASMFKPSIPGGIVTTSLSAKTSSKTTMESYETIDPQDIPTIEETLAIELLIQQPHILRNDKLRIHGMVTDEFDVAEKIQINVYPYTTPGQHGRVALAGVDEDGKFEVEIEMPVTGKFFASANAGGRADYLTLYTSNRITDILVSPRIENLRDIKFQYDYITVKTDTDKGEPFTLLARSRGGNVDDITLTDFGTSYRMKDSSVAEIQIQNGKPLVIGKKSGETTLDAYYGSFTTSATIRVNATEKSVIPESLKNRRSSRQVQTKSAKLQAPRVLSPIEGSIFHVNEKVIFEVAPLANTINGKTFESSWTILNGDTGVRAARLARGTDNYAEWIPKHPGTYRWQMCYFYEDGMTEYTPWITFTVTD